LRVRLLGTLASGITNLEPELASELSTEALDLAREVGDAELIAEAIRTRLRCWWDPLDYEDRFALAEEMREIALSTGNADLLAQSWQWRSTLAAESGDLPGLALAANEIEQANQPLGLRYFDWAATARRAALALSRGAFDDAERLIFEAHELERHGFSVFAAQFGVLRWLQGRAEELDGLIADEPVGARGPVLCAMRALVAAEAGRTSDARSDLSAFSDQVEELARHKLMVTFASTIATRAAVTAGPGPWVDTTRNLLEPLRGLFAVANPAAASLGALEGSLGALAALAGDLKSAEELLRQAVALNRAAGLEPFVAIALADLSEVLVERAPHQARVVAGEAVDLAARLGMAAIERRAAATATRC